MKTFPLNPLQTRIAIEFKHDRPLIGCRFDPSGRYLFVSSEDFSIQRFDLLTRRKTAFSGHTSWLRGMAFSPTKANVLPIDSIPLTLAAGATATLLPTATPKETLLLSGDYHGNLLWWDALTDRPKPIRIVAAHTGWIRAVAISPDSKVVATCGNDRLVKLWSVTDGKEIRTLEGHQSHVYNLAFHPDGTRLVTADQKGIVKDWEWSTGKLIRELDAKIFHKYDPSFSADIGGLRGLTFNADGSSLSCTGITNVSNAFAGVGNPLVVVFDWKEGKPKQFKPKETYQGTGWGVGFMANGLVAAGGVDRGRIWFWKFDDTNSYHFVDVVGNCRDMSIHPDGTALAVATHTGAAIVWTLSPFTPAIPSTKKEPGKK